MGLCSEFVSDSIGRISLYASTGLPTDGDDFYTGKHIIESDTNKWKIRDTLGTFREFLDLDGWQTFNPIFSGTGNAVGAGTLEGWYQIKYHEVEWVYAFAFAADTTVGAGPFTLSTPLTMYNSGGVSRERAILKASKGQYFDASTSTTYPLEPVWGSANTVQLKAVRYDPTLGAASYVTLVDMTGAIPVAEAVSDVVIAYCRGFIL